MVCWTLSVVETVFVNVYVLVSHFFLFRVRVRVSVCPCVRVSVWFVGRLSVVETEPVETAASCKGGVPPGGVKVRCSLDLADEFTCAWPALLLRHGDNGKSQDSEDDGDEDDEEGEGEGGGGTVEKWRVSAGFGGLVLSKVASGEGAAADSSPFLR